MSSEEVRFEQVAGGFSFPTSLAFDPGGIAYVAEAGLPFGGAPPGGRIWRLDGGSSRELIAADLRPPVNGLTWHAGTLYVSEGGHPARISRLNTVGELTTILDGLPGPGNYHTNMTLFGPEGKLYFSQGAMTNSGVVGLDAYELGWLRRLPHAHDLPGYDIVLAGANFETADPLTGGGAKAETGAFAPFGVRGESGTRVPAHLPCTASVMRCNADGGELELVAWGLRNAYGLAFLEDGTLLAIDQGADERGSRPVGNAPDLLYEIRQSAWYGWPDFIGGEPVTSEKFRPQRGLQPAFLLANHHQLPPPERPLLRFPAHAAAVRFEPTPRASRWMGKIFVALFGDERPMTAPAGPRVGRALAWIDPDVWGLHMLPTTQLVRPIDVGLNPLDDDVYVLDFGVFEVDPARGVRAQPESGGLWRLCVTPNLTARTRMGV